MNDTTRMTAWAQITLAVILVLGMLAIIVLLLLRPVNLPQQNVTLVNVILGGFMTLATGAGAYFFARHRPTPPVDSTPAGPAAIPTTPAAPAKP